MMNSDLETKYDFITKVLTNIGEIEIPIQSISQFSFHYVYLEYPFKIHQSTFTFLELLSQNKHSSDSLAVNILLEIYIFLSLLNIKKDLQNEIFHIIKEKASRQDMLNIYNLFIKEKLFVDQFEDEIATNQLEKYLELLVTYSDESNKENYNINITQDVLPDIINFPNDCCYIGKAEIYRLFLLGKKYMTNHQIIEIICMLYPKYSIDILHNFLSFIDKTKEISKEDQHKIINLLIEGQTNQQSDVNTKRKDEKSPLFNFLVNNLNEKNSQNSKLQKMVNFLEKYFVDYDITDKSSDLELFYFHESFLKNKRIYNRMKSEGQKPTDILEEEDIVYSKEMLSRGYEIKVPKVYIQSILNEKKKKDAYSKSVKFIKAHKESESFQLIYSFVHYIRNKEFRKYHQIMDYLVEKNNQNAIFFGKIFLDYPDLYEKKGKEELLKKAQDTKIVVALKTMKIPNLLGKVPQNSFVSCINLKEVIIENGIQIIESGAFSNCESLESIKIPYSVSVISDNAFSNCSSLKEIIFEDEFETSIEPTKMSLTEIGKKAFYNCSSLTSLKIPESVKIINESAFAKCTKLKKVTFTHNICSPCEIKSQAFLECTSLESVQLHAAISEISNEAFKDCKSLSCIQIPKSTKIIGEFAFQNCTSLYKVFIEPKDINEGIQIRKGVFSQCDNLEKVEIGKNSIISINEKAFDHCSKLQTIVLPCSLKAINEGAFYYCKKLQIVNFMNEKESQILAIGKDAFYKCECLKSIRIPDSVISIGEFAFSSCNSLEEVDIGNGIESIDKFAFALCENLSSVKVPIKVKAIEEGVFKKCTKLKDVFLCDGILEIKKSAFSGCIALKELTIPKSVNSIENDAFIECANLKRVIIQNDNLRNKVKSGGLFRGCHPSIE